MKHRPPVQRSADRLRKATRAFGKRADGSTAVEFALVGMPFFFLLGALIEAGILLLSQQTLDNALDFAARTVFTGSFQEGSNTTAPVDRLRNAVCTQVTTFPCGDILIDVNTSSTFAGLSLASPYDSTNKRVAEGFGKTFQCPSGSDVVSVRATVTVPRYFGFLDPDVMTIGTTSRLLVSTIIFRAEPYGSRQC